MHRKTTSRRESKRLVSKRQRAAERQVINGGRLKVTRDDSWAYKAVQPPIIDEVPKGHPKRKRKGVKKVICLTGPKGRHEYLKDIGVFETYSFWYTDPQPKEEIRRYKMCVHCGETKFKSPGRYGPDWYTARTKYLRSATESERQTV